jgi:hypothetical protein
LAAKRGWRNTFVPNQGHAHPLLVRRTGQISHGFEGNLGFRQEALGSAYATSDDLFENRTSAVLSKAALQGAARRSYGGRDLIHRDRLMDASPDMAIAWDSGGQLRFHG